MITIVLADDEKLIRAGLKKILLENLDIPLEIIEAKNGEEALELCFQKRPALLITDIRGTYEKGFFHERQAFHHCFKRI